MKTLSHFTIIKYRLLSVLAVVFLIAVLVPTAAMASEQPLATADVPTIGSESTRVRLSAGFQHSAFIDYDGALYVWGDNTYGQLGLPDEAYLDQPTKLELPEPVVELSLGAWHTMLLTESGRVYAFGRNTFGQVGNGGFENSAQPVLIEGLPKIKAISAGSYHSLALADNGNVWGWGNNTSFQLAQASSEELSQEDGQVVARRVEQPALIISQNAIAIAAGGHFSMYLDEEGTVFSWGENTKGQLGDGTNQNQQFPSAVSDLENIREIHAGYEYAMAVADHQSYRNLFAWGDHSIGQIGVSETPGSGTSRLRPVRVDLTGDQDPTNDQLVQLAAGYAHVLAVVPEQIMVESEGDANASVRTETGRQHLLVWGSNAYGQLGLGSFRSRFEPVVLSGHFDGFEGDSYLPFDAIAAGGSHSLVLSSKGQLAASGQGERGQLGNVSIINRDQLTYVETSDHILPAWHESQELLTDFLESGDFRISWPAAQDNLLVTGYTIMLKSQTGPNQLLDAGNNLERIVKNLDPNAAYSVTVYAYDQARTETSYQELNHLAGAWFPEGFDLTTWTELFGQPVQAVATKDDPAHNWSPDPSGMRQPLEVPWSQLSIYGEKISLPEEPFPLVETIQVTIAAILILAAAVWIGINFHKQRQLWYPLPPLPHGLFKKIKRKLLFLGTFGRWFQKIAHTIAGPLRKMQSTALRDKKRNKREPAAELEETDSVLDKSDEQPIEQSDPNSVLGDEDSES